MRNHLCSMDHGIYVISSMEPMEMWSLPLAPRSLPPPLLSTPLPFLHLYSLRLPFSAYLHLFFPSSSSSAFLSLFFPFIFFSLSSSLFSSFSPTSSLYFSFVIFLRFSFFLILRLCLCLTLYSNIPQCFSS